MTDTQTRDPDTDPSADTATTSDTESSSDPGSLLEQLGDVELLPGVMASGAVLLEDLAAEARARQPETLNPEAVYAFRALSARRGRFGRRSAGESGGPLAELAAEVTYEDLLWLAACWQAGEGPSVSAVEALRERGDDASQLTAALSASYQDPEQLADAVQAVLNDGRQAAEVLAEARRAESS